ncbi:MAG: DUF262 domain-containing protein [Victivallales bacterium]|nr:DUF262 domain-containing protein [Victivallales bacterium]
MDISFFKDKFIELFGKENTLAIPDDTASDIYPKYYQAFPINRTKAIHYELKQDVENGPIVLEFHFERSHYWEYVKLAKEYAAQFSKAENYRDCRSWTYHSSIYWGMRRPITSLENFAEDAKKLKTIVQEVPLTEIYDIQENTGLPVGIGQTCILDLFKNRSFAIPDYQRPYCWTTQNVERLLKDLSDWHSRHYKDKKEYHLGSIILKRCSNGIVDVIDGQQRLITLALLVLSRHSDKTVNILLGSNNETATALEAISKAQDTIALWKKELDLSSVVVSIVEIGEQESDDLAFNFFNHLNSAGVLLTDYELLKGHHLRYIKEDTVAKIMAARWHALDKGSVDGLKERLLHKCLFRIRKWLAHEKFVWNADEQETHDLFHEFALEFDMPRGLCTTYKEVRIDSMLSGGLEFFDYVNRYRMQFEQFVKQNSVHVISPLRWRSYGVLHDAIIALAFFFYCKFGDIYLKDAIYAIAWNVSSLRAKMGQVRRNYLGDKPVFRDAALAIARATHESEAIGKLLDREQLHVKLKATGEEGHYWQELKKCSGELEKEKTDLLNAHYSLAYELGFSENSN